MTKDRRHPFAELLRNRFGQDVLLLPPDTDAYQKDYSHHTGEASLVVRPKDATEVAAVLALCGEQQIPVVPSGGRTGFCGGATPSPGAVVLSLERLNRVDPVDTTSLTVRVGAGANTQRVHEHCEAAGLSWPIDLASRGSSQIGGNIATNAGGIHVVRYGMTRNWVLGLQVATMAGELLRLDKPLVKNNTGWDIMQLFIGSEGTLGVITEAVLRLAPAVQQRWTAFLAVDGEAGLASLVPKLRSAPFALLALEFLDAESLARAEAYYRTKAPLQARASYYVIVEYELAGHSPDEVTEWLASQSIAGLVDAVAAASAKDRAAMWLMREGLGEAWVSMGPGRTHDVSVSVSDTPGFLAQLRARTKQEHPQWCIYACGHLGDGNVHTHLVAPEGLDESECLALLDSYDDFVFRIVVEDYNGSVSAEHGIGLAKKKYLPWCRSPAEMAIFWSVKQLFDPKGLLNPGKVFD